MRNDATSLNEMIRALNDGRTFYQDAAAKVTREDLKRLFERMARTKTAIVNDMKNKVVFSGEEPSDDGSLGGGVRKAYADIKAKLATDKEASYVEQLEDCEDRILASFKAAIEESKDPEVRGLAQKYMPEVTRDHDEMRALKLALKH